MVQAYQATLEQYRKLAPLQERMMKHLEKEMDDMDDAESWKRPEDEDEDPEGDEENPFL
jgi:hypothetical protein